MQPDGTYTYDDIAEALQIPRGTLGRKLLIFNRTAKEGDRIHPDMVKRVNYSKQHIFMAETVDRIAKAIASMPTKKRGRPKTKTN